MWQRIGSAFSRENILGAIGAVGFFHEMLIRGAERPVFLGLCGTLMTLPFALGVDRKIRRIPKNGVDSEETGKQ